MGLAHTHTKQASSLPLAGVSWQAEYTRQYYREDMDVRCRVRYLSCTPALESIDHIILHCRPSQCVWERLGIAQIAARSKTIIQFVTQVHELPSSEAWPICFAACAVTLWRARNKRVFDHETSPANLILRSIAEELRIWTSRSAKLHHQINTWANLINP